MGRRSRKRGGALPDAEPAAATVRPAAARRRRTPEERPRAPWHPFPLVELSVLIGLVLLVWGLIRSDEDSGRLMLVCGMALASLGGLETALREHFSGYAPHALLIAALPAVLVAGVLFFGGAPPVAVPLAGGAVLLAGFTALRRTFRRRS